MTYLLVEKWTCRKAWFDLPMEERRDFVAKIAIALEKMTERA